jgi:hypothetical protein
MEKAKQRYRWKLNRSSQDGTAQELSEKSMKVLQLLL